MLDIVNEMYSDILPKSVAEHYGNERRQTKLAKREANRYDKALNYHGLGKVKLIRALEKAENPIIIIVSKDFEDGKKRRDRHTIVTDELDENRDNIVIIEQIDSMGLINGEYIDANRTITAYGKDYIRGLVQDAISSDTVLYYKKNKISTIARREEVQFLNRKSSAYFKYNIDDFWAKVNWERQKSKQLYSLPDESTNENI